MNDKDRRDGWFWAGLLSPFALALACWVVSTAFGPVAGVSVFVITTLSFLLGVPNLPRKRRP